MMSASKKREKKKTASEQKEHVQELKEAGACNFINPGALAANSIGDLARFAELNSEGVTGLDVQTLADELYAQNKAMHQGDLSTLEAMLFDQSHVLQTLFVLFTHKLSHAKHLEQVDTYSRIALKAQNQCRQTLATLGELKNPKRATFIRQQNNAVNQQINQDKNSKKPEKESNEVLEVIPSERLDIRETQTTIGANPEMETVGAIDRPEDRRRQAEG